jgi:uncharacterized protein GlcG (DUF336 family)
MAMGVAASCCTRPRRFGLDPKQLGLGGQNVLRILMVGLVAVLFPSFAALADDNSSQCDLSAAVIKKVQSQLLPVTQLANANGGIFKPNRMWSAIVDRGGHLCSIINTDATNGDAWPGSRAIAIAKAETANDFSNSAHALSTANLYAPTQPGGSLYGLNNSNPYNPRFDDPDVPAIGRVPGGIITFGGGVALYQGGEVIGGLGVSGDSSCADHAIAYRMRHDAGFDGTPNSDNIIYAEPPGTPPTGFEQPHCFPQDITP